MAAIDARIAAGMDLVAYDIPPEDGARLAWLYQHGEIVAREDTDTNVHVTVRMLAADVARFERRE
jgi:GTP-binding protein HflX